MNVLVIGAGPTGLTAALALSKAGIACRIVERRSQPSTLSRAVGIMPVTIEALRPLGASKKILHEAMQIRRVTLVREHKTIMDLRIPPSEQADRVMLALAQNRTEEILADALETQGIKVHYGIAAERVTTSDVDVTVTFSDHSTVTFDWVIAADGIKSLTREQLGIAFPGYDLSGEWSIADVDVEGDFDSDQILVDVQAPRNSFSMVLPIELQRARIVSSTPDALAATSPAFRIANVRRTGTFSIGVRQAQTYRKGRVLLAGDAAHAHSPVGGKGMNLGIADAIAAAEAIANNTVDRYSEERHHVGADIVKRTEAARRMVMSNHPLARMALSIATKVIAVVPVARRAFLKLLTQL